MIYIYPIFILYIHKIRFGDSNLFNIKLKFILKWIFIKVTYKLI